MRIQLLSAFKVSLLALVLSFGLSYVYAWTTPTVSAPGGNVSAPINTSATAQTKSGALNIATSAISSDTKLGSFGAPGSTAGVGYTSFGNGFVGWDYANNGIALNAHAAGGSIGGLFVQRVDNGHSNVGIGTVGPWAPLHINSNYNGGWIGQLLLQSSGSESGQTFWKTGGGGNQVYSIKDGSNSTFDNKFRIVDETAGGIDRLVIDTAGNVGVGTPIPDTKLRVAGGDIKLDAGRTISAPGRMHIQADNENLYLQPWTGATYVGYGGGVGNLNVWGDVCTSSGKCLSTAGGTVSIPIYQCGTDTSTAPGAWATWGCLGQISSVPTCSNYAYSGQYTTFPCTYLGTLRIN